MNDKDLDQLIKKSLTAEEAAYYDKLDEPNLVDKISMIYTGKLRWITMIQSVVMTLVFIFFVYAALEFYNSTEVTSMLRWGFAALLAFIASSVIKLMLLQIGQEKIMQREMKRIELQLANVVKARG